ncbi:MAG: hypothetical protein ACRDZZ_07200 [Ilumatobacteraceae bacterium]
MVVKYERSGLLPSGGPQPGTTALRDLICDEFSWCPRLGFYNSRDTAGNPVAPDGSGRQTSLSLHAEGRAFDAMTTKLDDGDPLKDWCVENFDALQIQEVIWQKQIWTAQSMEWNPFKGKNPHTDHLHIGQSWFGAKHPEIVDAFRQLPTNRGRITPRVTDLPPVGVAATLATNEFLRWDDLRASDKQQFFFVHQSDGNVVLYDDQSHPLWANGTVGLDSDLLVMQDDGNLVLYATDGTPLWSSDTAGNPGAKLEVHDDGRVVIVDANRQRLFAKP